MPSAPTKKPAAAATGTRPPRKTAAKPAGRAGAAKADGEKPAVRPIALTPTAGAVLRARDLTARVAKATETKMKDIRATIEATLSELGKALDAGETLNLPPLGKLRITPGKTDGAAGPMKLKLRRGAGPGPRRKAAKEALAEPGEPS